jgi:hypothetical protein
MGGTLALMTKMRNEYENMVRKPTGKRPLGRPRFNWDNMKWSQQK